MPPVDATKKTAALRVALRLVREHDTGYDADDVEQMAETTLYAFLAYAGYEYDGRGWTYWGTAT